MKTLIVGVGALGSLIGARLGPPARRSDPHSRTDRRRPGGTVAPLPSSGDHDLRRESPTRLYW
jgi:hypothetical protein